MRHNFGHIYLQILTAVAPTYQMKINSHFFVLSSPIKKHKYLGKHTYFEFKGHYSGNKINKIAVMSSIYFDRNSIYLLKLKAYQVNEGNLYATLLNFKKIDII